MNPSWLSYVPSNIGQAILANPAANPVGLEQRTEAVALFADVSGFTAISEALGQAGKAGTEELTQILNAYFETMIDLIQSYGGIVGQFGGDALTVLFPYVDETKQAVVRRAIQCALDMQSNMGRYEAIQTRAGTFRLTMKAGLAAGPCFFTTLGGLEVGLKYVIAGQVLDHCADAEHHAERGEVVVHNHLLPFAGELSIAEEREGFSVVAAMPEHAPEHPLEPMPAELPDAALNVLAAYLHPVIAERQWRGQSGFINEHRKVTVLFINFMGFDYDGDPDVVDKLQGYFASVMRIIQRYDGYLNKIDMGDKGSKYIVLFGAPVAHEDDEERALRCALELRSLSATTGRIGVNTGFVYCGLVGSDVRREYTVMGDAVNLSARMMQAAQPDQILVSGFTHRHAATHFTWDTLPPVRVKGKTEPIAVFGVLGVRGRSILKTQELDYGLPMVGRAAELAVAEERITQVLSGRGQIIGITAEAGMGKSRLNAEIVRLASARGFVRFGGECESFGTTTSYLVWHHIWQNFFGIEMSWLPELQQAHVQSQLADIDPSLVKRLPLLAPALNIPIPDNEMTAALDAKLRKASLESMLVTCLRARATETPLLLVLEDCHWMDPLSFDLLEAIARNIDDVPVLMLLLYRPPELANVDIRRLPRFPHFVELALADFTPQEAAELIELKLRQLFASADKPPAELVELVTARAQGNPFYIDEIINLLRDHDIDPRDIAALRTLELPESLHSLIISRIDRLVEDEKITLKVASVIGRMFPAGWLWRVYPQLGQAERVREQLFALRQRDFVMPASPVDPEVEYLFKHVVTQEVAYESLSVATREELHEAIASFIEQTYPDTLDRYLDLLAFHYAFSDNLPKQREYFWRAGEAAQATYANDAAVDYYRRLLPLLPPEEQAPVLLKLGKVWELTGQWDVAEETYQRAFRLAEEAGDAVTQAQCYNELGRLRTLQGHYDQALADLQQAHDRFERASDRLGICKTLINMGNVHLYQGDFPPAQDYLERALPVANEIEDRSLAGLILGNLGLAYGLQGDADKGLSYLEQQVQIKRAIGDERGVGVATGNMGVMYENKGDYTTAMRCYQEQLLVANEVGDQRIVSLAIGNIGILYSQQGDYESANACYARQLQIALELGDRRGMSFALADLADVFVQTGQPHMAERLIDLAILIARTLMIQYELCRYLFQKAQLWAQLERYGDAQPLNDEALAVAQEVDRQDIAFKATILATELDYRLSRYDARQTAERLTQALADWPEDKQRADIYYELWRLNHGNRQARHEAAELYERLYTVTPNFQYRQRYEELTGGRLDKPAPLPPLPAIAIQRSMSLEALLRRAEARLS